MNLRLPRLQVMAPNTESPERLPALPTSSTLAEALLRFSNAADPA